MSGKHRVRAGYAFEREVRSKHNFERFIKAPRITWSGEGKNNAEKILSLNKNPEAFKPIFEKSRFDKADAKGLDGTLYEIKKYSRKELETYTLYSEPIIKVAPTRRKWGAGDPFYEAFKDSNEYNYFINGIVRTKWWRKYNSRIMKSITHSNCGLFTKDGFIPKNELEFKWVINDGQYGCIFDDYHRLSIVVRIKPKYWYYDILKMSKKMFIINKFK
jgi:hypothetical protein